MPAVQDFQGCYPRLLKQLSSHLISGAKTTAAGLKVVCKAYVELLFKCFSVSVRG